MKPSLPWALAGLLALGACASEPEPLPTEAAVDAAAELDRAAQPPLYQLLYDAPLLPGPTAEEQRVRLLIWLRHMKLSRSQLARLEELRQVVVERSARIAEAERQLVERYSEERAAAYEAVWTLLAEGVPADDPRFAALTDDFQRFRAGGAEERELMTVRLEGIRGIVEAEKVFLRTLSPGQEQLMADSLFFLRHALDPVGQPGTFRELVGTTYDPGQYAVLTRGTGEISREPLDIGGLWADEPSLESHTLHGARREVLLYLAVQQPGLEEAIAAAIPLASEAAVGAPGSPGSSGVPGGGPPPVGIEPPPEGAAPPGAPQPGEPGGPQAPAPGEPAQPEPGEPEAPEPGVPSPPEPAAPGSSQPAEP